MAWHLSDRVESFLRLELEPEILPFKAHADLNNFKLATSGYLQLSDRTEENIHSQACNLHLCS